MKVSKIDLKYVGHYGNDLMVVNRARVSFSKSKETFDDSDINLIQYLARGYTNRDWVDKLEEIKNCKSIYEIDCIVKEIRRAPTHFMPFAHPHATFHLKVPIWLSRQLAKHQIGFSWSEESRRYIHSEPEMWFPEHGYRASAKDVKQGSVRDKFVESIDMDLSMEKCKELVEFYNKMIDNGVAPEHARTVLPQNMMVEFDWTGSLMAWSRLYNVRSGHGAQYEHEELMAKLNVIMTDLYPHSWAALCH